MRPPRWRPVAWTAFGAWCSSAAGGRLAAAAAAEGGGEGEEGKVHMLQRPEERYARDRRIESARLYGNINQYAYYFTDLLVGQPKPQRVSVIVDTGSSLCGFPCKDCEHCGYHIDPPFNFQGSESARWVPCGDRCTGNCLQGHCYYTQSYTEGSSIWGFWFQDEVRLGDALQNNPPVNATLGCHKREENLFYTQRANGIMGMAPHKNSGRPTILQDLFVDKKHVNPDIFAMCLGEWGGELTVGGWNPVHNNGSIVQWIPLTHSGYYSVLPYKLLIGGMDLGFGPDKLGTSLVDSGTTFTYFPSEVFKTLSAALIAACETSSACGARREGSDCWRLNDGSTNPGRFPPLALAFRDNTVAQWPPRAYLFQRGEPSLWCHAFADSGPKPGTVLGVSWMLHKNVIFDLEQSRLGLVEAECPQYKKAPGERLSPSAFAGPGTPQFNWKPAALGMGLTLFAIVMLGLALDRMGYLSYQEGLCSDGFCSWQRRPSSQE